MRKSTKALVVILMMLICMFAFSVTASAQSKLVGSGKVTHTISWTLTEDGVLTISGTGEIPDYSFDPVPWAAWYTVHDEDSDQAKCDFIKKVVVEEGITEIGSYAFEFITGLKEAVLPDSLESLGYGVFQYCTSLEKVNLPKLFIKNNYLGTFWQCTSLTVVKLPAVTDVSWFAGQKNLTDIYYPGGETSWKQLTGSDKIPSSVKIHYYYKSTRFYNCTASIAYNAYTYTGSEIKPVVTVRTAAGTKLKRDVNYTLSYENNVDYGTATITVTPIGKYTGEAKTITYEIRPAKVKNLRITESLDREVTIEWDPSTNVKEYMIYNGTTHREVGRTESTTYTITGIHKYNQYRIWVYAIVEDTNEENGETVEVKSIGSSVRIHS